jgi:pyruvate/2-oxoglutarate dehydrogenase complex dihydrolipoamide acyltransferase (E2) component
MADDRGEVLPFPPGRATVIDGLKVGARRRMVHALAEVDITEARGRIRGAEAGARPSVTAFVIACFARALAEHPRLHAGRDLLGRLVVFREVDVTTLVEAERGGVAFPHVLRAADGKTAAELTAELRRVKASPGTSGQRTGTLARLDRFTPGPLRRLFLRLLRRLPRFRKRVAGTAVVTSLGSIGSGTGWAIPIVSVHTVGLAIGGIARRPGLVGDRIEPREYLQLTLSFDHDLVDGAPAARFLGSLAELLERAHGL